jgi:hypothetical protein
MRTVSPATQMRRMIGASRFLLPGSAPHNVSLLSDRLPAAYCWKLFMEIA